MSKKEKSKEPLEPVKPAQLSSVTEKEEKLGKQLTKLDDDLRLLKEEAEKLREENEFLQEEAHQTKQEMNEYMKYIERKTKRRQGAILSLNDKNVADLDNIQQQKEMVLKKYEEKKQAFKRVLIEKEKELQETQQELNKLDEFRILKEKQEKQIADLEGEVVELRSQQTRDIEQLKVKFLEEKKLFADECNLQLQQLTRETTKEAKVCLEQHAADVKLDNQKLRKELLRLIQHTRALQKHKLELVKQQMELKHEQEFAKDLQKIRKRRANQLYNTFAVPESNKTP